MLWRAISLYQTLICWIDYLPSLHVLCCVVLISITVPVHQARELHWQPERAAVYTDRISLQCNHDIHTERCVFHSCMCVHMCMHACAFWKQYTYNRKPNQHLVTCHEIDSMNVFSVDVSTMYLPCTTTCNYTPAESSARIRWIASFAYSPWHSNLSMSSSMAHMPHLLSFTLSVAVCMLITFWQICWQTMARGQASVLWSPAANGLYSRVCMNLHHWYVIVCYYFEMSRLLILM